MRNQLKCFCFLYALAFVAIMPPFVNSEASEGEFCVCVPYWECKEDYSGFEDGIEIDVGQRDSSTSAIYDTLSECEGYYDVCCQVRCGLRKEPANNDIHSRSSSDVFGFRILGDNNEAEFGEFPWMLGILEDKTYRCGASLIHPQVAVTAAHCVTGKGPFTIRAGEWNWESLDEPTPHQDRTAKKVVIHPHYQAASLLNDIALVIMDKPFKLSKTVLPACLPHQGLKFDGERCVTMGWGKNSHRKGSYQPILKKLELPIVNRNKCLKTLQNVRLGPFFNLHGSFICAGGEEYKDTCKGDGGSPLLCPIVGQKGRYQQVGIVSWGLTCGFHNVPGVYVNMPIFVEWIDFMMSVHGFQSSFYKY